MVNYRSHRFKRIIRALHSAGRPLTAPEISVRVGMSPPSVHRLIRANRWLGWVRQGRNLDGQVVYSLAPFPKKRLKL